MVQKRDSPSMVGSGGREEEKESLVGVVGVVAEVGWEVEGERELGVGEFSTTSSASRLTGSPIVVSFASLDKDGLSSFWEL